MSKIPDTFTGNFSELYSALGYAFVDEDLLALALTHCSYDGAVNCNNQRMEYLGDAVLELVVSDVIYRNCSNQNEGTMTRIRARIVCEDSLCEVAKKLNLGKYLRLGKGEETSGGRNKSSILADAVEALIGCIYLESGMEAARDFILRVLSDALENAVQEGTGFDYKTELQKTSASRFSALPIYQQVECTGPAHDRTFYMRVLIQGKELGRGVGHSKKEAEQKAALEAIQKLKQLDTTH